MAKKEKKKQAAKKKKANDKKSDKDKDKEAEHGPPLRSHHNYEVNKPPFPPKITAERTKKVNEHEQQQGQGQEQQSGQKGQKGQGGSKSGGGGEGGGGGGGDQVKGALQAIVQYVDDSGNVLLDPHLADLVTSAKRILSEQGGE